MKSLFACILLEFNKCAFTVALASVFLFDNVFGHESGVFLKRTFLITDNADFFVIFIHNDIKIIVGGICAVREYVTEFAFAALNAINLNLSSPDFIRWSAYAFTDHFE